MRLRLATRASQLALWQAETAKSLLEAAHDGLDVELVRVHSSGDRDQTTDLARFGRIGIFTVEVDRAVLDGRADVAVHSLKDLTTTLLEGTALEAVLERGPVEDAWVCPTGLSIEELPEGARVASGSLRRRAMLARLRPDLELTEIRGNVDTRLGKLARGEAVATVLARAGLVRLGLERHVHTVLDVERFLPAVAQGLVGLTCREGDEVTAGIVRAIQDDVARDQATAERAFLKGLRGGCNVPAGGHATIDGDVLTITGRVLAPDGSDAVEVRLEGSRAEARALGERAAEEVTARGGARWIDALRNA